MTARAPTADGGLGQFGTVRIRKAADDVVAILADAIRSGLYEVGDHLPSERDLAAELGVSRPVVSEALDILETSGVITARRGKFGGTTINSLARLPQILARVHGQPQQSMESLIEVRRPLELEACLLAAERGSAADFVRLRQLVGKLDELFDRPEEFVEMTVRFHVTVAKLSGNPVLAEFLRSIVNRLAVAGLRLGVQLTREHLERVRGIESRLADAIERNDAGRITAEVNAHIALIREIVAAHA